MDGICELGHKLRRIILVFDLFAWEFDYHIGSADPHHQTWEHRGYSPYAPGLRGDTAEHAGCPHRVDCRAAIGRDPSRKCTDRRIDRGRHARPTGRSNP